VSALYKLKQSRDNWKQKAIDRGEWERAQKKENARLKKERDRHKKQVKQLWAQLEAEKRKPTLNTSGKEELVYLALQLFSVARIGFRAVSRVLSVLSPYLGLSKAPCPQTIINWVTRLALVKIQQVATVRERSAQECLWMIDISIGLGAGKILSVLALDIRHHQGYAQAPTRQEVSCMAVAVSPSWTGENIAAFLDKVMAMVGTPAVFLKDGGTDLGKAVRLLNEQGVPCRCIDDISHKIANLFKSVYADHPVLDIFLSACGKVSTHLKQTVLACLAPAKVSVKARFMNLHRLVRWADRLLKQSPAGTAAEGSLLAKLRDKLEQLPLCKDFIGQFLRDATPLLACQKILKTHGLNDQTRQTCEALLETLPLRSPLRTGFMEWLTEQLEVAKALEVNEVGLPISTDLIESLFGVGKQLGTGEIKDAYRIALRQPALCGGVTREEARRVLAISVQQQKDFEGHIPSLTKQRRDVLPHPGRLETLAAGVEPALLELIPRSETRKKNVANADEHCVSGNWHGSGVAETLEDRVVA
jgi:hypothetical protein